MSRRSRHGRRQQPDVSPLDERPPESEPIATATPWAAESANLATATPAAPDAPAAAPERATMSAVGPDPVRVPEAGHAGDHDDARVPGPLDDEMLDPDAPRMATCTQAQLRRFIKSRPWIPMHELRRRFGIAGGDDDVTPVKTANGMIFVGLPHAEGRLLGELLVSGDVGYELSLDPGAPIVVGVYPMRPVPRG